MSEPVPDEELLPLSSLKRYLQGAGWHHEQLPSGLHLYSLVADPEIEIFLPIETRGGETARWIGDALATLAAVERRSAEAISQGIQALGYDRIRSRLPDGSVRHNTIRMDAAEEFVTRMKKVLVAAAHAELHSGPYFNRASKTAILYADGCRFGHTYRGSFGFTIESLVGPNPNGQTEIDDPPAPLSRRAVARLARGLNAVQRAVARRSADELVNDTSAGLNANAYEDLAALVAMPSVQSISFSVQFSPEWKVPAGLGHGSEIALNAADSPDLLRAAASSLRVQASEKRRTIVGLVRTLHSMEVPAELFTISGLQDVVIEWESEEFGRRNVRVPLGPEEYLEAVKAHTAGQRVVVTGELERGRRWMLENARDFKIV